MSTAIRSITRVQDADDVSIPALTDGYALAWDNATQRWVQPTVLRAGGLSIGVASPTFLADIYQAASTDNASQSGVQVTLTNSGGTSAGYTFHQAFRLWTTHTGAMSNGRTFSSFGINLRNTFSGSTANGGEYVSSYGAQIVSMFAGTAGGAADTIKIFGGNISASGDMGNVADTRHEGLLISASGTAQQNYALRINSVTDGDVNYGIYITGPSVVAAGNYAIYSTVATKSYLAGSLGIGISAPLARVHVDQSSTTGAIPVLTLDQGDVSEEFLRLIGTSGADASQSLVDAVDRATPGSIAGWLKVYIQDDAVSGAITDGVYYVPFYSAPSA